MTKYVVTEKIGPVSITEVTAEILSTPPKYMLDCDYATFCEWGVAAVGSPKLAVTLAREHAEHHAKNGPESKAWVSMHLPSSD